MPFLVRLARGRFLRAGASDAEAEEAVQEVWLRLLKPGISLPEDDGALQDYLAAAVLNEVRFRLRSGSRRKAREEASARAVLDDPLAKAEEVEAVHSALADLGDEERLVLLWAYWDGLTYAEIGALLSIPENSVGPRLSAARAEMRRILHGSYWRRHA